jgi:hypothetical protein
LDGFLLEAQTLNCGNRVYAEGCVRARAVGHGGGRERGVSQRRVGGDTALLAALRELDVVAEPCQALEDALACGGAAGLDLPDMVFGDLVELQLV